jgi:hypothetical protein
MRNHALVRRSLPRRYFGRQLKPCSSKVRVVWQRGATKVVDAVGEPLKDAL